MSTLHHFHRVQEKVNSSHGVICLISTIVFLGLLHLEYSSFPILQHITNVYIMLSDICRWLSLASVDTSFHPRETLILMNSK